MVEDSRLLQAYREANQERRISESKIGSIIALLLVPAGNVLDYFLYPEYLEKFLAIRLVCSAVIALCFALHYTNVGKTYIKIVTFMWLFSVQVSICYMIYLTDGYSSTYYAGLNLAIFGIGLLLPTSVKEAAFFCGATLFAYCLACVGNSVEGYEINIAFNNLFFLVLTSIIGTTAVYFSIKGRFVEFSLSYELDKKNQALTEVDRQKSQFFANISHELRTPLTLILAPVQELLEGGLRLPDTVGVRLGVIRDNALRLLKLVNDLLDVIRLEEGKSRLQSVPIEINGLLSGLVDSMRHLADTKDIILNNRLNRYPLVVKGDIRALEKIFVNLLNNAVKFTEKTGSVTVTSRLDGTRVVIEVNDTGIGIEGDDIPHIFDRFRQVDGSSTRQYQGTGLGLALVKEMAEKLGGEVRVDSRPGLGTTMSIVLPEYKGDLEPLNAMDMEVDDGLADMHQLADLTGGLSIEEPEEGGQEDDLYRSEQRPTVLVVDDEPDMRRYLVGVLEQDYRVLQARNGREGLESACRRKPDMVVLDLMLPEMDGLEVCRRIKQDEATRSQKIILLTARVDEQAKLTALENGADDFLTKPFSSLEVKTRLQNLWETARLEQDLAERNQGLERALADLKSTQGQLIQSEKLNALGSLSAGLLHEINNPLNYSLTALQLVRGDHSVESNELLREMLEDIDEGMQRIRLIVSDLRAFAYPSQAEKQAPFDFRDAVESALRFTAHELKGMQVEQDFSGDTRIVGSQSHIVQVLVNLLGNAIKATEPLSGERLSEIRIDSTMVDGRLHARVSDNGVGMDGEVLAHIFDPFFTTREVGAGMGLGLSICHTIIENHGGKLRAESRLGEGTVLSFDLPLETEQSL